jgi:hypothetical protein
MRLITGMYMNKKQLLPVTLEVSGLLPQQSASLDWACTKAPNHHQKPFNTNPPPLAQ